MVSLCVGHDYARSYATGLLQYVSRTSFHMMTIGVSHYYALVTISEVIFWLAYYIGAFRSGALAHYASEAESHLQDLLRGQKLLRRFTVLEALDILGCL